MRLGEAIPRALSLFALHAYGSRRKRAMLAASKGGEVAGVVVCAIADLSTLT